MVRIRILDLQPKAKLIYKMTPLLPPEFEARIKTQLGSAYLEFIDALRETPPVSIRHNPKKKNDHQGTDPIPWASEGRYLPSRPVFTLDPLLHAGIYYVQEASSMFLEQVLKQSVDLAQSLKVLDLCAAPGGKSTHLLSLLNSRSLLVSNEIIRSRVPILSENIQKWGHHNVVVTNNDPEDFQSLQNFFDVIVIDAPCSGEGLFRKDPVSATEWSLENVELCAHRQQRIIDAAWPALKENGVLIYSTCTYNEKENEGNLVWLKGKRKLESIAVQCQDNWGVQEINKEGMKGYRLYPHCVKGEGFFVSAIRKLETTGSITKRNLRSTLQFAPYKMRDRFNDWLINFEEKELILLDDLICMIPKDRVNDLEAIISGLRTVLKGTAIATPKHDKLIPEHALALSIDLNKGNFLRLDLSIDQALSFLRKENMTIGEGQKGFALMCYQGHGLGWVNLLGNRLNNLYPSPWRIRMG